MSMRRSSPARGNGPSFASSRTGESSPIRTNAMLLTPLRLKRARFQQRARATRESLLFLLLRLVIDGVPAVESLYELLRCLTPIDGREQLEPLVARRAEFADVVFGGGLE